MTGSRSRADRRAARIPFCAVAAVACILAGPAGAKADDRDTCLKMSFAPLDVTVPACDRVIGSGRLGDAALVEALIARANAYGWAMTYSAGHDVDPDTMLASQLADLDRAVQIARRVRADSDFTPVLRGALSQRANVHLRLGHYDSAVADFSEAIDLGDRPGTLDLLGRSMAYQRTGRLDRAIADMSAMLEMPNGSGNAAGSFVRRAELHETVGNTGAAVADYRKAIELAPDHAAATAALGRLDAGQ